MQFISESCDVNSQKYQIYPPNDIAYQRILMQKITSSVVGIFCVMAFSGLAFAQDEDTGLTLSASSAGTYSNNFLKLSHIEAAERPNLSQREYSLTTNANLGWTQKTGGQYLYFNANVGYRFNKYNSYLDSETAAVDGGVNWQAGAKCDGTIAVSYTRSQADFEYVDDIINNSVNRKSAKADSKCLIGSRWGISGGADVLGADNSEESRSINDLADKQLWIGLRLNMARGDYASITARRIGRQYDNRIIAVGVSDENKQYNLGLEFQKSFGPNIIVEGWVGYSKLTNKVLPVMNYTGLSGKADISYKIGGRHLATFGARREIDSSANLTASYIKVKGFYFNLASTWGSKLHTAIRLNHDERDIALLPAGIVDSSFNNSHDKTKMVNASFSYDIRRLISIKLAGRIADRNALVDRFDYKEKAIILSLNFRYD